MLAKDDVQNEVLEELSELLEEDRAADVPRVRDDEAAGLVKPAEGGDARIIGGHGWKLARMGAGAHGVLAWPSPTSHLTRSQLALLLSQGCWFSSPWSKCAATTLERGTLKVAREPSVRAAIRRRLVS